eukprot:gi/632985351/ref/XP_007909632.1/ PREDICTED: apolipoprotein L3-like [Callorhinchus milii]
MVANCSSTERLGKWADAGQMKFNAENLKMILSILVTVWNNLHLGLGLLSGVIIYHEIKKWLQKPDLLDTVPGEGLSLKVWWDDLKDKELSTDEERDLEEAEQEQHDEDLQSFLQVFPDQNKCIRDCIQDLGDIANDIEKCQESSNIAKVTGSSVRMVGGLLAVGGAIAAPFTLGASLALTAVGTGLGIAGNATNFTAGAKRSLKKMKAKKRIDAIVNKYNSARTKILACFPPSSKTEPNTKHRRAREKVKKLITVGLQVAASTTLSAFPLLGDVTSLVRNVVRFKTEKKKKEDAEKIREEAKRWEVLVLDTVQVIGDTATWSQLLHLLK